MARVAARGSRAEEDNAEMASRGSQADFSARAVAPSPAGEPPAATGLAPAATGLAAAAVRKRRWPQYPTRLEVQSGPGLLTRHMPAGWLSNREIAAAAGVFLATNLGGCGKPETQAPSKSPLALDAPAIVAPLFQHGEGRGATGCIVSNPPVFLSEADALQIITEELSRSGVTVRRASGALPWVDIPVRFYAPAYEWSSQTEDEQVVQSPKDARLLTPDLECEVGPVVIEYMSAEDYDWAGPLCGSTVTDYDLVEAAGFTAARVRQQGKGIYFAALYDPLTKRDRNYAGSYDERRAAAHAQSEVLLRQQVRDFVDWLKAQGAI
jgi:hypothetical protein